MQVCNVPDPRSFSNHISISQKCAGKNHSDPPHAWKNVERQAKMRLL